MKEIEKIISILKNRKEKGCRKAGYKCIYVDDIESLTRSTRNTNPICIICNNKP